MDVPYNSPLNALSRMAGSRAFSSAAVSACNGLSAQQSTDFYEIIIARHRNSSFVIEGTSYRQRLSPHRRKEARKGALTA